MTSYRLDPGARGGAASQIAAALREAILSGRLTVEERLPGEQELAERFGVSRPTVREALKRLAAQNLIRTRRGATGGSFVNRMTPRQAQDQIVTAATLLIAMAPLDAEGVAEARLALLSAAVPLACARRSEADIAALRKEIAVQRARGTDDAAFCGSDVRFHRRLADAARNPLLSLQLAGVVEAVQPLFNMITLERGERAGIVERHMRIAVGLEARDVIAITAALAELTDYTARLVRAAREARDAKAG